MTSTAVSTSRRIEVLDVLRGVAILGTLGTNIWIFTDPRGPAGALAGLVSADAVGAVGAAVQAALLFVTNGKFLALLTLLFGVGLELQYRSARRRGRRWPGWYLWRAGLLFVEGVLHYLLVFEFDVLMAYALIALIVAWLIGRSDRVIRAWMIGAATVHVLFVGLLTAALAAAPAASGPAAAFSTDSWTQQVADRIALASVYRAESVIIIPLGIVLFLAGARLLRAGALADDAAGHRIRVRLMVLGLGVAAPLNLLTAFGPDWLLLVDRYLLPPFVALGLLALVTTVVYRIGTTGRLGTGLTATGRTALSCYVFQNLVASALCYGWGLGLADRLADYRPWWVVLAWLGICVAFMVLAVWWLRRFDRGPLEAVWHWAYQAPQRRLTQPIREAPTGRPDR